jgi:multimeric flavodoxin WrbA
MKINVYYGGRGLLDDPTLYVLKKMEDVLRELRVNIERFNIYEHKNEIATLPLTFKEADGIILATTIEWLGIGGYMQQFLDMVIRKKSAIPICSRLLCPQPMESAREN